MRVPSIALAGVLMAGCACDRESAPSQVDTRESGSVQGGQSADDRLVLKMGWPALPAIQIEGVTETYQMVTAYDEKGKPIVENGEVLQNKHLVREVLFKGIRRPYRVGDKLGSFGRRYTITAINRSAQETSVEFAVLAGDD
jgi:hypothetical protein